MRRRPFATVLVGPSVLLREGLARILGTAEFRIVASVSCVQDIVATSLSRHHNILLIIDSGNDPDAAVAQIEIFKKQHPSGRIAVVADQYRIDRMIGAFQAGANVYFAKLANCAAFMKALELVMLGETILPPELLSFIGDREDDQECSAAVAEEGSRGTLPPTAIDDMPRLSTREKSILRCIVEGDSNKFIARKISIAEATVKVHVKAILRKIRIHNRTQAAIWAMNNSSIIWPADVCPPPAAVVAAPPPLAPENPIGSTQLPVPIDHSNGAKSVTLADIDSGVRKGVSRRSR
jgi:DNA-binding NarL/FixJ family response regulator